MVFAADKSADAVLLWEKTLYWLSVSLLQNAFQERIVQRREAEFGRLKKERDERISQLISSRKRERETVRKLMYYLNLEEQRIETLREEEEARKREGKWILNWLDLPFVFFSRRFTICWLYLLARFCLVIITFGYLLEANFWSLNYCLLLSCIVVKMIVVNC